MAKELAPSKNSKTDGDVGPAVTSQLTRTQTRTPARIRSHEREAHRSFHCADISCLKHTQKLSSVSHMSRAPESQQCTLNRSPLEGNIPLGEKAAVSNPTVLLKLETVCLSAPTAYMEWL